MTCRFDTSALRTARPPLPPDFDPEATLAPVVTVPESVSWLRLIPLTTAPQDVVPAAGRGIPGSPAESTPSPPRGGAAARTVPECGNSGGVRARTPARRRSPGGVSGASGASPGEVAAGGGRQPQPDAGEAVEGGPSVAPPVPAEHGPVGVALETPAPQAVVHAHGPALQVREDPADPRQDPVGRAAAGHPFLPGVPRQAGVAAPAVGDHPRARRDGPGEAAAQWHSDSPTVPGAIFPLAATH